VLWSDSVIRMAVDGVVTFLELGPVEVLSGVIEGCRMGLNVMAGCAPDKLELIAKAVAGGTI